MDSPIKLTEEQLAHIKEANPEAFHEPIQVPIGERIYIQFITGNGIATCSTTKSVAKNVMQRALNTWADAPQALFELCDGLDKI
jgi:hypothetical protein